MTLFAVLRAAARPLSLSVAIAMATVLLAPVLAWAAQPDDDAPFICRVAAADEAPTTPPQDRHPCPCPGLCGMGGPILASAATTVPAPNPPTETAGSGSGADFFRAAFQFGFRPFLRGPPLS